MNKSYFLKTGILVVLCLSMAQSYANLEVKKNNTEVMLSAPQGTTKVLKISAYGLNSGLLAYGLGKALHIPFELLNPSKLKLENPVVHTFIRCYPRQTERLMSSGLPLLIGSLAYGSYKQGQYAVKTFKGKPLENNRGMITNALALPFSLGSIGILTAGGLASMLVKPPSRYPLVPLVSAGFGMAAFQGAYAQAKYDILRYKDEVHAKID